MTVKQAADNIRAKQGITDSIDPDFHADQIELAGEDIPMTAYCDFDYSPVGGLLLTTTPVVITEWTELVPPIGISQATGNITVDFDGVYNISLERIYKNDDQNPLDIVTVSIAIEADTGSGFEPFFSRTAPISAATSNNEPAILSFTTPANRSVTAGTMFRILVSGQDGGGNPQECYLARAKVTANLIHNLPQEG